MACDGENSRLGDYMLGGHLALFCKAGHQARPKCDCNLSSQMHIDGKAASKDTRRLRDRRIVI